jgi:hypothetical protein
MKPNVDTDTVTAFSSHRKYQRSTWKRIEDGYPFPFNCYNCGMRGHKMSECRRFVKFSGNY